MKHTPGPWKIVHLGGPQLWIQSAGTTPVCELSGERVADIITVQEAREANARLIATAPELLEALEPSVGSRGCSLQTTP